MARRSTGGVAPKTKKTKKTSADVVAKQDAAHPTYQEMAKAAIASLQERGGSSKYAILKYITGTYGITQDKKVVAHLRAALVKGVASGTLKQVTGMGASGSFKINKDKPVADKKKSDSAPKKAVDASKKKTSSAEKKKAGSASAPKMAAKAKSAGTPKAKSAGAPKAKPTPKKLTSGTAKKTKTSDVAKPAPVKKASASKSRMAK